MRLKISCSFSRALREKFVGTKAVLQLGALLVGRCSFQELTIMGDTCRGSRELLTAALNTGQGETSQTLSAQGGLQEIGMFP